jgi:hypothetical protein
VKPGARSRSNPADPIFRDAKYPVDGHDRNAGARPLDLDQSMPIRAKNRANPSNV